MILNKTKMYSSIFTLSILFYLVMCEEKLAKENANLKSKLNKLIFHTKRVQFSTISEHRFLNHVYGIIL